MQHHHNSVKMEILSIDDPDVDKISIENGAKDTDFMDLERRQRGLVVVLAFIGFAVTLENATVSWNLRDAEVTQFEVFLKDGLDMAYKSFAVVNNLKYENVGLVAWLALVTSLRGFRQA